ncbi:hypothetical protein F2Q69_00034715 [Brassica cretica]|uniref:Uncharacterized protein n=1 Tax=Brassica cretica TaxID=69181 RepID=A0A8S9SDC9_BRACR|nr:hypothetical protein F2Q69_00034715 [Brassica cretica]
MVRRKYVGKFRRNSDNCTVNRNVVGNSSEYTDELPTTTTVTFFIGISSKSRQKIPTSRKFVGIFRRISDDYIGYIFYRNVVEKSSENSDDPCFVGIPSEMADGILTTSNFWISLEIGRISTLDLSFKYFSCH